VVEFVLVLPAILLVLLAMVEVAVVARTQLEVVNAAREGAREAATSPDPAKAVSAVQRALGASGERARVEVIRSHVVGEAASVVVRFPLTLAAPLFGGVTIELRARSVMRVEQ
jgi:hypothetical protein